MKKLLTMFSIIFICMGINAYAYEFPQQFWTLNSSYENAVNNNDNRGIIEYGLAEVSLMESEPDCEEKNNLIGSRLDAVGKAYAAMGLYDESADCYRKYIPYAQKCGWTDGLIIANSKVQQYTTQLRLFTDGGETKSFGAKNEKLNGVLYGVTGDSKSAYDLPQTTLMLVYVGVEEQVNEWTKDLFRQAAGRDKGIEIALNCTKENDDIVNIQKYESNLKILSDLFNQYPNIPVYVRFGAEFDVWGNPSTPADYIKAFQYVSNYFKKNNSNVAMIWSGTPASSWGVNADDFYPGDEYVDWVGLSLYGKKYFQNKTWDDDYTEVYFKTGINADPVIAVQSLVEKYGNRKPIFITESGYAHKMKAMGEDTTNWAVRRLQECYTYLPMVYPQIKAMTYFDQSLDYEDCDYALFDNNEMLYNYKQSTSGPRFIQRGYSQSVSFAYKEITDGSNVGKNLEVNTYAHLYGDDTSVVKYYMDGNLVGYVDSLPFKTSLDLSAYDGGTHTLTVTATGSNGKETSKNFTITVGNAVAPQNVTSQDVSVTVNGKKIEFTQPPIIYNDRTMVPLRAIFEALGATVNWDAATKTVVATKGDITIILTIGASYMYKGTTAIPLDVPAMIYNDFTLVPVRAIADALGCTVNWNAAEKNVEIIG